MKGKQAIKNMVERMMEFQEKNSIEGRCIANTQYLLDNIKAYHNRDAKARAVIVFSSNDENLTSIVTTGHLVVSINDKIIDPSYDISFLKNKVYFDNIKDLNYHVTSSEDLEEFEKIYGVKLQTIAEDFLTFSNIADRMNNGELIVVDEKFYNDQADYVDAIYLDR